MCPALRDAFTQESGLDAVATTFSMPTRVAHIAPGEVLTLDAEDLPFSLPVLVNDAQALATSRVFAQIAVTKVDFKGWNKVEASVTPSYST